jgi:hypothetical protein
MDRRQGVEEASSLDLRYLDPEEVRVWRGEDGRVYCTIADELTVLTPMFIRSHPLSDLDLYLSIRGVEPKKRSVAMGKEFGLLRNWHRLDPHSHAIVEGELERRYLHPKVFAILSVRDYSGVQVCEFDTDRGWREVTLRDVRDNVIYLGRTRVLITDAEGNRYDIEDVNDLDPDSLARLARIL